MKTDSEAVSVIIPTYNRAGMVKSAVDSVLSAVAPGDEVIVIDDGSTDDTEETLGRFGNRIRYVKIDNSGVGVARNLGIRLAKSPLISFLDSDDEWMPDKLSLQRGIMSARPYLVFCFSNFGAIKPDGRKVHDVLRYWKNAPWLNSGRSPLGWDEILGHGVPFSGIFPLPPGRRNFPVHIGNLYLGLLEVQYVTAITILVRRQEAGEALRFAEDQNICEDWECFARLARKGPVAYLDCETAYQRIHNEERLTDVGDDQQASARIQMIRRVWGVDGEFLKTHGERYREVLALQHLRRAKWLIRHGRTVEAREELARAGGGPMPYRVLSFLPGSMVRRSLEIRSRILDLSERWGKTAKRESAGKNRTEGEGLSS
jgi:glycosyltransferase involved in cell wall biosynthesis